MLRVAIIEDEKSASDILAKHINQYGKINHIDFLIDYYSDGDKFIFNYSVPYDIAFMDIEMPNMNGIEAAKKLREIDSRTILVFVTNMAKYAVNGYEVDATGFLVKPINYYAVASTLQRAIRKAQTFTHQEEILELRDGLKRIALDSIYYIECYDHYLFYYTTEGTYKVYGQISNAEERLKDKFFYRCQKSFLINLKHVFEYKNGYVIINNKSISVSRFKRKEISEILSDYIRKA